MFQDAYKDKYVNFEAFSLIRRSVMIFVVIQLRVSIEGEETRKFLQAGFELLISLIFLALLIRYQIAQPARALSSQIVRTEINRCRRPRLQSRIW